MLIPQPQLATSSYSANGVMSPIAQSNTQPQIQYAGSGNPYSFPVSRPVATQPQSGGGMLGISDLSSAGRFVSNGFQLPQSQVLNSFGTQIGLAPSSLVYSGIGPSALPWAQPGALAPSYMSGAANVSSATNALGVSSASSALGAAGIGALAGNFLGRIGGNTTGGSIGGGLGAGIGMAVGGPVGAAVGGLLGGIGGGFFGGKKPATSASEFLGSTAEAMSGSLTGMSFGSKNAGEYDGYNQTLSTDIGKALGDLFPHLGIAAYNPLTIRGGVNTLHSGSGQPGFIQIGGNPNGGGGVQIGFDPNNAQSRNDAITRALREISLQSGATEDQFKEAVSQVALAQSPQGQAKTGMPFIPINDSQRFSDFMNKFNQGNTNA